MTIACAWLVGISIATVGGGFAAWAFIRLTSLYIGLDDKPNKNLQRVPPWLTGLIERAFFLMLIVFRAEGITESMIGWLAIKLASNWQRYSLEKEPTTSTRALLALLAGAISLAFAYFGGMVIRGEVFPRT